MTTLNDTQIVQITTIAHQRAAEIDAHGGRMFSYPSKVPSYDGAMVEGPADWTDGQLREAAALYGETIMGLLPKA